MSTNPAKSFNNVVEGVKIIVENDQIINGSFLYDEIKFWKNFNLWEIHFAKINSFIRFDDILTVKLIK